MKIIRLNRIDANTEFSQINGIIKECFDYPVKMRNKIREIKRLFMVLDKQGEKMVVRQRLDLLKNSVLDILKTIDEI